MKLKLLALALLLSAPLAHAGMTEQATIYLNVAETYPVQIQSSLENSNYSYYACKNVKILEMVVDEFTGNTPLAEAGMQLNPWSMRNLDMSVNDIKELSGICGSDGKISDLKRAKELIKKIVYNGSLESVEITE